MMRYPWFELSSELWRILSIVLGSFYLIFYLITVVQLCLLLYHRHRFPSYHSTVLMLGSGLNGFRLVYFGQGILLPVTQPWVNIVEEILCWFPLNIQYMIITTLFIYYCKIIYGRHWEGKQFSFFIAYGLSNGLYLALAITWFVLIGDSIDGPNYLAMMRYLMVCIPDIIIIICLLLFAYTVGKIRRIQTSSNNNSWGRMKNLNIALIISLVYRVILYILMILYLFTSAFDELGSGFDRTVYELLKFSDYIMSEILPVFAILFFLKQIPGAHNAQIMRPNQLNFRNGDGKLGHSSHPTYYTVSTEDYANRHSPHRYGSVEDEYDSFDNYGYFRQMSHSESPPYIGGAQRSSPGPNSNPHLNPSTSGSQKDDHIFQLSDPEVDEDGGEGDLESDAEKPLFPSTPNKPTKLND